MGKIWASKPIGNRVERHRRITVLYSACLLISNVLFCHPTNVRRAELFWGNNMQPAVTVQNFKLLMKQVVDLIGSRPLDQALQTTLNRTIPPAGALYTQIVESCHSAIAAGWMCARQAGGIKFGRVVKPDDELNGFSVDVVDMTSFKGPHHAHPHGEVDLIMPLTAGAQFDGHGAGWLVYGPGSAHHPTVTDGRALILYLLPRGAIEFSR
jgi:hypothetical protein